MGRPRSPIHPSGPSAKITRPTLPEVFPRTRLFRVLDHARTCPVVWISGPPGAGKTTLVASYLTARSLPTLWYQVDAGDADPATWFYYVGIAAKRAAPRYKTALPLLTPEYRPELGTFTRRYVQALYERLPTGCVLVLDNYHTVPLDSPFHEVIRDSLEAMPPGRRVLVISRSEPPPSLARLRASQALEVIDGEALRATPQETRGIVRLKHPLSGAAIRSLHETTSGWTAGIILLAQRATSVESLAHGWSDTGTKEVFDYFAGEIFDRSEAQVQKFLLQTAFLPKMTVRMVEHLTGIQRSGRILGDLNRQNYFTEKRGEAEAAYQYHSLFRKFLLDRAQETWTPATLSQVRHRAATVLEQAGQLEDAVGLFREAGDWAGVSRLALGQAPLLIAQGRHATLEGWLTALPSSMVDEDPWLLYWLGVCHLPFNPPLSQGYFGRAFERFVAQQDDMGSLCVWSGAVNSILFEWTDFSRLDRWIAWLDERMQRDSTFPSPEIEARVVCDMVHALIYRQLFHRDIRTWVERALSLSEKSPDNNLRLQFLAAASLYYFWTDRLKTCGEMVKEIKRLSRSPGVTPLVFIQGKWTESAYYWLTASYDLCLQAVSEGLEMCRTSGVRLGEALLYAQGIYASMGTGDLKLAGELLSKLEAVADHLPRDACHYHLMATQYALCRGEGARAVKHGEEALGIVMKMGMPFGEAWFRLPIAHVMYEQGAHRKAARHLEISHRMGRRIKSLVMDYMCLLTRAQFAFDADTGESEAHGLKALREAMRLGREQGYAYLPAWQPRSMARLCAKALEHQIEVNYVQHLIHKLNLLPDPSIAACENWPWSVKVYTLGRFGLVRDGAPLRFAKRGQGKVIELLKVLIALGSREVEEERLTEALWPEADGDTAHQTFKTTLHRLRKLLGNDEVVSVRDGRVTLEARHCWVDVWAFKRLVGRDTSDMASMEKAVALYQGRFLGQEAGSSWAMGLCERLHAKFLRCVSDLGRRWEEAREWRKAAICYERGLGVDPLVEEYYQRLIVCHHRQGHRAEAVSVYKRCRSVLQASLGIVPSSETESICRNVKASGSL